MTEQRQALRREWLRGMYRRQLNTTILPPLTLGERVEYYRGRPLSPEWPTEAMMRADLAEWARKEEGRRDVSAEDTFRDWVLCADGRTLWEFASPNVETR